MTSPEIASKLRSTHATAFRIRDLSIPFSLRTTTNPLYTHNLFQQGVVRVMEPGGTPAHSPPQYTSRDPSDSISVSMRKRSHDEMSDQNISRISQDSGVVSEIHTEGLSPEPSQNLEVLQQDQPLTPDESAQSHSMLPDQPLEVFDWDLFEANYHEMIRTKEAEEDHLAADFRALCQVSLRSLPFMCQN